MNTANFHALVQNDMKKRTASALHKLYGAGAAAAAGLEEGPVDVSKSLKYERQSRRKVLRRLLLAFVLASSLLVSLACTLHGAPEFAYRVANACNLVKYRDAPLARGEKRMRNYRATVLNDARPRLVLVSDFLSDEECRQLIVESGLGSAGPTGRGGWLRSWVAPHQLSFGAWVEGAGGGIVYTVRQRVSDLTGLPAQYGEPLYVTRAVEGQAEAPHHDWRGGEGGNSQRAATLLIFLTGGKGGDLTFPRAGQGALRVAPQRGAAVLWMDCVITDPRGHDWGGYDPATWPLRGDVGAACGGREEGALHGTTPVEGEDRWAASMWLHDRQLA